MSPGVNPEDAHYSAEEMKAGISELIASTNAAPSHARARSAS